MQNTIHNTPVVKTIVRWMALFFFKMTGWKVEGRSPNISSYVIIAAPHTSNWDFIYTLCSALILRIIPTIMMKDSYFFWPIGYFFRWLGALPIDRSKANNVVAWSIQAFQENSSLVMVVPPSGTRKKVIYWKSGFYHIANGAKVPIVLGFLDYRRKVGGIGQLIYTTGDIKAEMKTIRDFYVNITGKYPLKMSSALAISSQNRLL